MYYKLKVCINATINRNLTYIPLAQNSVNSSSYQKVCLQSYLDNRNLVNKSRLDNRNLVNKSRLDNRNLFKEHITTMIFKHF
jgi:hypothetical protein